MALCNKNGIGLLGEHKIKKQQELVIHNKMCSGWERISNIEDSPKGRIWVIWRSDFYKVVKIQSTDQLIHCSVTHVSNNTEFAVTFIYASNDLQERKVLWLNLMDISQRTQGSWLLLGDFNNVLTWEDRMGGNPVTVTETADFQECVEECDLWDMRWKGQRYTWQNNQLDQERIYTKIDRVLVNHTWRLNFPMVEALFLPAGGSDHSPMVIQMQTDRLQHGRMFRYFNMWSSSPNFRPLVQEVWDQEVQGNVMFQLVQKMKALKPKLRQLNKGEYDDIEKKTEQAKLDLMNAQIQLQKNLNDRGWLTKEKEKREQYIAKVKALEAFMHQKAKAKWINYGDQNTTYFHRVMKEKQYRTRVVHIEDENGKLLLDYKEVTTHFTDFYKKLLGTKVERTHTKDEVFGEGPCLTLGQQLDLIKPYTKEDVKKAMYSINKNKSPGPDGYGSGFYKDAWDIVGEEVTEAVLDFFTNGKLLKQMNCTCLALIPKTDNPTRAGEFRPIACCNTVYKCISKMLTWRLAQIMPYIINENQGAFVKNRSIVDNVLISQEIIRHYNRKNASPRCLMKIDIKKAYDSVDWEFIAELLEGYKFPRKFSQWIMECIQSVSFTVVLNGDCQGQFQGKRGIRQGSD